MSIRVGINGFGRMGRLTLRAAWDNPELQFVQINDPAGDAATLAHLLAFDSVHGRWDRGITADGEALVIEGTRIPVTRNKDIVATDWSGCDVVIESSGKFRKPDVLQPYLDQGVKRVVVTAPVKSPGALDVVVGVNHDRFDPAQHADYLAGMEKKLREAAKDVKWTIIEKTDTSVCYEWSHQGAEGEPPTHEVAKEILAGGRLYHIAFCKYTDKDDDPQLSQWKEFIKKLTLRKAPATKK